MNTTKAKLLNERQTAKMLGVSRSFLRQSRMDGRIPGRTVGPPFIRFGRSIRYAIEDLEQWILEHREEIPEGIDYEA